VAYQNVAEHFKPRREKKENNNEIYDSEMRRGETIPHIYHCQVRIIIAQTLTHFYNFHKFDTKFSATASITTTFFTGGKNVFQEGISLEKRKSVFI